jgi:hypothetical protein
MSLDEARSDELGAVPVESQWSEATTGCDCDSIGCRGTRRIVCPGCAEAHCVYSETGQRMRVFGRHFRGGVVCSWHCSFVVAMRAMIRETRSLGELVEAGTMIAKRGLASPGHTHMQRERWIRAELRRAWSARRAELVRGRAA